MDRDVRRDVGPRRPSLAFLFLTRAAFTRAAFAAAIVFSIAFGYGISGRDRGALETFTRSVDRWQSNPEFRSLAVEYSVRGSEALRTRPLLVPADRLIIVARSCPLLPERYALTPTCRAHYEGFSRGPLCAYLHLCDEQAVHHAVAMLEELGRRCREDGDGSRTVPDEAALRDFLGAFRLDSPVVKDAGAVQSVAALVAETDVVSRAFRYRTVIGTALALHVQALAAELGFPADARAMTVEQQRAVLDRLDGYVRRRDPELWRTKQVSDFCAGIWAHVFGRNYNVLLKPFLALHAACRVGLWALLLWAAIGWLRSRQVPLVHARAFAVGRSGRRRNPGADASPLMRHRPEAPASVSGGATSTLAPAPPRPARARRRPS
jgi:hypothetical protein